MRLADDAARGTGMRGTQITLFVIGLLILGTQTFRHVYVKWIEPTSSVLDEYRPPIAEDIADTKDLDELVALYDVASKQVKAYEQTASLKDIDLSKRTDAEPYKSEAEVRTAIERWEAQSRSVFQLRFYWLMGLLSIVVGLFAYARINPWLGMVGIITGFTEMAVWTSPLWHSWGPQSQFERLLNQKLLLSILSMALLIGLWLRRARNRSREETAGS
jgi:hypothetical protein